MKKQIQHITTFDIQTGQITIYMDQNKAAETLNQDKRSLLNKLQTGAIIINGLIITNNIQIIKSKRGKK